MLKPRIALLVAILAAATMCTTATAGILTNVELEASMHIVEPGDTFVVSIDVSTTGDLTSVNPAISLDRVVGSVLTDAEIVADSSVAGELAPWFWNGPTTVTELLDPNLDAGKFNVSLDTPRTSDTGAGTVVTFSVTVPDDAVEGDKWSINFIQGATGSTYSVADGSGAETEFTNLGPGMISVIPEPSSVCLLLVGMCLFLGRRRSGRHKVRHLQAIH